MLNENGLIEKFQKIEALYLRATTEGEKAAAFSAMASVQTKINSFKEVESPREWSFSMQNEFEKKLFKALLHKYGLESYRYKGQRYTTVTVRATKTFVNQIIWPQYLEMSKVLSSYLEEVTNDVIKKTMGQDDTEDEIRSASPQISYQ